MMTHTLEDIRKVVNYDDENTYKDYDGLLVQLDTTKSLGYLIYIVLLCIRYTYLYILWNLLQQFCQILGIYYLHFSANS